jgi:hypothetical protein
MKSPWARRRFFLGGSLQNASSETIGARASGAGGGEMNSKALRSSTLGWSKRQMIAKYSDEYLAWRDVILAKIKMNSISMRLDF